METMPKGVTNHWTEVGTKTGLDWTGFKNIRNKPPETKLSTRPNQAQ